MGEMSNWSPSQHPGFFYQVTTLCIWVLLQLGVDMLVDELPHLAGKRVLRARGDITAKHAATKQTASWVLLAIIIILLALSLCRGLLGGGSRLLHDRLST